MQSASSSNNSKFNFTTDESPEKSKSKSSAISTPIASRWRKIDPNLLSLSDSEIDVFHKAQLQKAETQQQKIQFISARNSSEAGQAASQSNSFTRKREEEETQRSKKLIDELILHDFEMISQSTDKDTGEDYYYTENTTTTTTTSRRESSPSPGKVSSTQLIHVQNQNQSLGQTSLAERNPCQEEMESGLPDYVMLNISGLTQVELGSQFVQVGPDVCLRSDCYLLLNAPPVSYRMASAKTATESSENEETEQVLDKETQTTSDDNSIPKESHSESRKESHRESRKESHKESYKESHRETRKVLPLKQRYYDSPRKLAQTSLRSKLKRSPKIAPVEELSENTDNESFRSWLSQQNALELDQRLQKLTENVQDCHSRRPESRKSFWAKKSSLNEQSTQTGKSRNPFSEDEESRKSFCAKKTTLNEQSTQTAKTGNPFSEDEVQTLLPNEIPDSYENESLKNALKLFIDRSDGTIYKRNGISSSDQCSYSRSDFREYPSKILTRPSSSLMWSPINEIEIIGSIPNTDPDEFEQQMDKKFCNNCWNWLKHRFFMRNSRRKIIKKCSITKTYFIRWRENPESKNSLIRTNSCFF